MATVVGTGKRRAAPLAADTNETRPAAPLLWWCAHNHRVTSHRQQVRRMVTGALLIAGFVTLPFGRLLGQWLFA